MLLYSTPRHSDLRSESSPPATFKRNQKTQTRGENVDKKTLVPDGDAGATGGANQHKWREEDEADPPRRCSFAPLVSSRRMREKGKETTCSEV
jgi:hypothetical protein